MKEVKIIKFSPEEVLRILGNHYNKEKGTNHGFQYNTSMEVSCSVDLKISMWDKDEITH